MTAAVLNSDPILTQSLDLGFLDNFDPMALPEAEFDGEMVPVDSFFNSYVENLEMGARGSNNYAGQLARMDTGDGALLPGMSLPLIGGGLPAVPLDAGLVSSALLPLVSPATSGSMDGYANGGMSASVPAPAKPEAPAAELMPQIPAPAPPAPTPTRGGHSTRGVARGHSSRASAASSEDMLHHLDHEKTKRNPKQQLQNKQAQQRYRERRKQRFQELEGALAELTEQTQAKQYEIAGLQKQNATLQGRTQQLTDALAAKEAELTALKKQMAATAGVAPASSDGHSSGTAHNDEGGRARAATSSALSDEELRAARGQYDDLIAVMKNLAGQHNLRDANPLGEGVAPEVLEQVKELVQSGCRANQELERSGGIRVLEVMGRCVDKLSGHSCAGERARWGRILETLRLAPRQEEALLALRKQHLAKLKQVYHTRQSLNMQAMGMMLPSPSRNDVASRMAGADPTLEGKMACMSIGSYLDCAQNTLQLDSVLDQLKDNLRDEQRAFLELKLIVLHRVLSPLQTLLFVTEAHPARPDALALANSVALKLGRAAEGCPKAAELLKLASAEMEAERKASAGSSGLRSGSLEGTDDSHKSDCCSLDHSGSGGSHHL